MRRFLPMLFAVLSLLITVSTASATTLTGTVTKSEARWTTDGDRIITESVVRSDDGTETHVSQLGGTADGLTMRLLASDGSVDGTSAAPLQVGQIVKLQIHAASTLAGATMTVVDRVDTASAADFVRTGPTKGGKSLYWESGCAQLYIDPAGTVEITGDAEFATIDEAVATWNNGVAACSYMKISTQGKLDKEVGKDKFNVLKFRDTKWCRPATATDAERCYSPSAAGLTTVVFVDDASSDRDGAIVDADIELNGVDFAVSINGGTRGTSPCLSDIKNTLTHELGHFLGLEHTCLAGGDPARVDDAGNPVPFCTGSISPAIRDATMFNFQSCAETIKQTLTADDIAGVCKAYPLDKDPGECTAVGESTGCCDATSNRSTPWLLPLLWSVAIVVLLRKRNSAITG
jgi:hypothetical protein